VIGTDIIRYDIYGKDILIANKMESSSQEGRILISQTTKNILEQNFPNMYQFFESKIIKIPSVNTEIMGYFLNME
jgi:class 3 adenylate cyclase